MILYKTVSEFDYGKFTDMVESLEKDGWTKYGSVMAWDDDHGGGMFWEQRLIKKKRMGVLK